jgi:hypothetical protein
MFVYGLKVYITPEDVIDKLSDEDKKRFNQCVFTDVIREGDGSITIKCIVFDDPDPYVREQHIQKYFSDGSLKIKHGHWVYWDGWCGNHDKRIEDAVCSECGYKHRTVRYEQGDYHNFVPFKLAGECPGCGAIMDKC